LLPLKRLMFLIRGLVSSPDNGYVSTKCQ